MRLLPIGLRGPRLEGMGGSKSRERDNDDLVDEVARYCLGRFGASPRSLRILEAMREIDRALFLPPGSRAYAYRDEPESIGEGQTCSQPSMVAVMLEALDPLPGCGILEVGSGCGYVAALLARLVGPDGSVHAAEIVPSLAALGRTNLASLADRVCFIVGDGSAGFPEAAPFDRILVSAGVRLGAFHEEILVRQLSPEGILVYPERCGQLYRVYRRGDELVREEWGLVAFVPLVGRNA